MKRDSRPLNLSPPPSEDRGSSNTVPVVPDLNEPTQPLHDRIHQLESLLEESEHALGASDDTVNELLERVASLSTSLVIVWARLKDSDEKKRVLTVALFFALVVIFALLAVIVGRST